MPGEVKLKPCPICGAASELNSLVCPDNGLMYWPNCSNADCCLSDKWEVKSGNREAAVSAWNRREPEPGTSVIRWTRYDGTTETLPEIGAEILLKHGKSVIVVISQCVGADSYLAIWRNPPFVPERGDLWAYLPEPTEGMK